MAYLKTIVINNCSARILICAYVTVFFFLIGIFSPTLLYGKSLEIAIFIPHEDPFWKKAVVFTEEAAGDLGMKLRVYNANDDPEQMVEQVQNAARSGIDGIIFVAYQNTGERILRIAEKNNIPAILINSQLPQADLLPRTKYTHWIGSVLPDDEKAGSVLIQQLINEARQMGIERFNILAIEGNPKDEFSIARIRGLRSFMKHLKGVDSFKIAVGNWNRINAHEIFQGYYKIKSDVNVVWCANDNMAIGVVTAIKELGLEEKIVVGGVDWDKAAQEAILNGRMNVSVGGHFLDGAWAAVLLFDYLNGIDFANERLQFESQMVGITRANLKIFSPFLSLDKQLLNFRLFSKALNQQVKLYSLDLNAIANMVAPHKISAELTDEEKAWLAEHKHIRLGVDPAWPPFEFFDITRVYSGIASDYVRLLSKKLDIEMVPIQDLSWSTVMDKARANEIDVLPCVLKTPERSKFLWFTKPYLSFPMVILTREDASFINDIKDFEDNKVAVVRGYATQDLLEQDYPGRKFYLANNLEQALKALSKGEVDAYVGNLASITYATQKLGLTNLKVATTAPYKFELAFAVRKDWPQLVNILNKSLEELPDSKKAAISNHWISVRFERGIDWMPIFQVAGAIALVAGVVFTIIIRWNRALSKEVTDRKLAEKALLESRATARGLLDATQESLILLDKEGTIIGINQTAARRHGRTPEELIGTNRFDIIPENIVESRKAHFEKVLLIGEPQEFEDVRDGMVFHHIYYPVQDKAGAIMGVAIFAQDITERKLAEKTIMERDQQLTAILDHTLGLIGLMKPDGTIIRTNKAALEMGGISETDIVGQALWKGPWWSHSKELQTWLQGAIKRAAGGEFIREETTHPDPEGEIHFVDFSISPIKDNSGNVILLVPEGYDITDKKKAEEAIRESRERLNTILKTTAQGFWLNDEDDNMMKVNEAMCEILGLSKEQIVGSNFFDFLDEKNREIVREQNQMRKKGIHSMYEISLIRSDGQQVPCLMNASPLFDADGNVIGSFGMTTNIAERKQMEEELRRNVDELERFSKVAFGREKKMIQLKQEINELMIQSGKVEKYKIVS